MFDNDGENANLAQSLACTAMNVIEHMDHLGKVISSDFISPVASTLRRCAQFRSCLMHLLSLKIVYSAISTDSNVEK